VNIVNVFHKRRLSSSWLPVNPEKSFVALDPFQEPWSRGILGYQNPVQSVIVFSFDLTKPGISAKFSQALKNFCGEASVLTKEIISGTSTVSHGSVDFHYHFLVFATRYQNSNSL
jgi:hypothetical protein